MFSLIYREENTIPLKNFQTEIRGLLDVKHLIADAVIHTKVEETDLQSIIRHLLEDINELRSFENITISGAQELLFSSNNEQKLKKIIQGYEKDNFHDIVPTWFTTFCQLEGLKHRQVGIAFLKEPTNFGLNLEEISVIILVLSPPNQKETKTAYETCRTFATIIRDDKLRLECSSTHDVIKIKERFLEKANDLRVEEYQNSLELIEEEKPSKGSCYFPGKGIIKDFRGRLEHYKSDFTDGFKDARTISKVISTAIFLVFTILPTSIAYGMLNDENTNGMISVQKVILGQWIGGLVFGILGGQALLIITTTAPLSIYISVIYEIALQNGYDFLTFYCYIGIWAQILLILYAIFQIADLISIIKRSTEETFGLFIAGALTYKAFKAVITNHINSYSGCLISNNTNISDDFDCNPSSSLLFIILVFGTLWLSLTFSSIRKSIFLNKIVREVISDYALPLGVCIMAVIGNLMFYNVETTTFPYYSDMNDFQLVNFNGIPKEAILTSFLLSIPLSLLFLIDQVLVTKTVDNKQHKLKKGSAYHWDLVITAILNIILSLLGLPWMHAALPSAFLHLKALSDVEDRHHNGYIQEIIVNVRETRLAVLLAHILMIPIYFWLVPFISLYIPTALFHGLFLFMAMSSLTGNEFWERILLVITDQRSYPPTHYIRLIPQKIIHIFTIVELIQLIILFVVGFYPVPYVEMAFPIVIVSFIPIRLFILPLFFRRSYLDVLDGKH